MGREGETPAQFFWHIDVQKKWYKLSKLGGGGGGGIWTKSKKTATFFGRPSLRVLKDDNVWEYPLANKLQTMLNDGIT